ncbi:MAG: carbon storage regulator [Firmicutes bacterium]|nr:carbon storage regulator [Bacillota bacterium]
MLILQRRANESIFIGENIEISVLAVEGNKVRVAIKAPSDIPILRGELIRARDANKDAAMEQAAPSELLNMLGGVLPNVHEQPHSVPVKPVHPAHGDQSEL